MNDATTFESAGFATVRDVLSPSDCDSLTMQLASMHHGAPGQRMHLDNAWCRSMAVRLRSSDALASLIPAGHVAVQCISFEKSGALNWLVPAHQDLSIPVARRVEHDDLIGWSLKDECLFVQPPEPVLRSLVVVRLSLDACGDDDGPLEVVPGTHALGRVPAREIRALRRGSTAVRCTHSRGDAFVMRPLLIHASSKATGSSRRRVLHFVYGPRQLPCNLQWSRTA
ncbi:hypothetical protein BH10PSE17_BH10PSE17_08280 [soil metagenome]